MTLAPTNTYTTQTRHEPYLTNYQVKRAPTGVPWKKLVSGGTPQEQEAELSDLIEDASTWVDSICMQVLAATQDTEQGFIQVNRYGQLTIHQRYQPATQLTDLWIGATPSSLTEVSDLSNCWVEPKRMIMTPSGVMNGPAAGLIQLNGAFSAPGSMTFARWTYTNGWPVTTLAENASVGDTTITVVNPTGILAGFTPLSIRDGNQEALTVESVSGDVVTLAAPLQFTHRAGAACSALPKDVETSVRLAVTGLAKLRGTGAITAATTAVTEEMDPLHGSNDLAEAEAILVRGDYVRAYS